MRLIDADALLQTLSDMCCADNNVKTRQIVDSALHNLMPQIISDEPTVDAQPVKRGRWIYSTTIGGMRYYRCTNCSGEERDCIADENEVRWYNFCPNCGARMEVDEDEQTQ